MNANELLKVAGSAVKVADTAEELVEFVESLGDAILELTNMDEWEDFRLAMEEYVDVRDRCGREQIPESL